VSFWSRTRRYAYLLSSLGIDARVRKWAYGIYFSPIEDSICCSISAVFVKVLE
jgi:hypothetical protein